MSFPWEYVQGQPADVSVKMNVGSSFNGEVVRSNISLFRNPIADCVFAEYEHDVAD